MLPRKLIFLVFFAVHYDYVVASQISSKKPIRYNVTTILNLESETQQMFAKMFKDEHDSKEMFKPASDDLSGTLDHLDVAAIGNITDKFRQFGSAVHKIDNLYKKYLDCLKDDVTEDTINAFVKSAISAGRRSLIDSIIKLRQAILREESEYINDNLFSTSDRDEVDAYGSFTCVLFHHTFSYQMQFFELFKIIAITEIRGYAMTIFAYKTLEMSQNKNFKAKLKQTKAEFMSWYGKYKKLIRDTMMATPRDFHSCEPREHADEAYIQLAHLDHSGVHELKTISLISQKSDVFNNMVVTGVKFEKSSNMIHIKIKEGKLLPGGRILEASERWVPLPNITMDNDGSFYVNFNDNGCPWLLFEQAHILSIWNGQNTINLDDIMVPDGYVVTGVQMAYENDVKWGEYQPFGLAVLATPFDFVTGQLTLTRDNPPKWIKANTLDPIPKNYKQKRTELKVDPPHSQQTYSRGTLTSKGNQFMKLTGSDTTSRTFPFFDAQPVETKPGVALGGIGLSHASKEGSSGLLTFRLFSIDIAKYLKV